MTKVLSTATKRIVAYKPGDILQVTLHFDGIVKHDRSETVRVHRDMGDICDITVLSSDVPNRVGEKTTMRKQRDGQKIKRLRFRRPRVIASTTFYALVNGYEAEVTVDVLDTETMPWTELYYALADNPKDSITEVVAYRWIRKHADTYTETPNFR